MVVKRAMQEMRESITWHFTCENDESTDIVDRHQGLVGDRYFDLNLGAVIVIAAI